jgi:hypothetical protein
VRLDTPQFWSNSRGISELNSGNTSAAAAPQPGSAAAMSTF